MMTDYRRMIGLVGVLVSALFLAGCPEVGVLSPLRSFTGTDSLTLSTPRADVLDLAQSVGKSMGYYVSGIDKDAGTVSLTTQASTGAMIGIGKTSYTTISVTTQDSGKKLVIRVEASGNFGTANQETVQKVIDAFKTKLQAALSPA